MARRRYANDSDVRDTAKVQAALATLQHAVDSFDQKVWDILTLEQNKHFVALRHSLADMQVAHSHCKVVAEALIRREEGADVLLATEGTWLTARCPTCKQRLDGGKTPYTPCCGTRLKWPKEKT